MSNRKYMLLSTFVLVILWSIASHMIGQSIILPSPLETVQDLIRIVSSPSFMPALLGTLRRVFIGLGTALILALILGTLSGFISPLYYLLKPIILLQRVIPSMAIILLALIWLNRELAPILVGFLVVFPIIYSSVVDGIRNIDPKLIEMSTIYNLSLSKKIFKLYLPSIQSSLLSVAAAASGLNIKVIIAAEVLSQPQHAMGTHFQIEKATLNTSGVFAWSIIAILIAIGFELLIKMISKKLLHTHITHSH